MDYPNQTIPAGDINILGYSVDILGRQKVAAALVIQEGLKVDPGDGVNTYKIIENYDDYSSFVSATMAVEGSGWTEDGEGSLKTTADYLRSERVTSQSISLVRYSGSVVTQRTPTPSQLASLTLPPTLANMIMSNAATFLETYGTHVAVGVNYGGYIMVGIKITALSASDETKIKAAFSAAFNAFEVAKGELSSSLQDDVNQYSQQVEISALVNRGNVNPPALSIDDLQAMNDYVDKQFETDLSVGGPLTAVCYAWEKLPCVLNIQGFKPGTLSPDVDLGVVQTLKDEYQRLQCARDTALTMQTTESYVGLQSGQDLQRDLDALNEAIGRIDKLTFSQICALTAETVNDYVVADKYAADLGEIASGRTHITWGYGLDQASWQPNGYVTGQTSVVNPTTDASVQVLFQSNHGDGEGQLGVIYQLVPPTTLGGPISSQVQLQAAFNFPSKGRLFTGDTLTPSQGPVASKAYFFDPNYGDYMQVAFASPAPAAAAAV